MKRREKDFVVLYNALWYQDFPVTPDHPDFGRRAVWTTHIASTVKQCADLMGLFTCFESGGRTDAVIQTADRRPWAKIEWEWDQPASPKVNEFGKLANDDADVSIYIGYSRLQDGDKTTHEANLRAIDTAWKNVERPLLVFLTTFEKRGQHRDFLRLETHIFSGGEHNKLRQQEAYPWEVGGTKWQQARGEKQSNSEVQ